MNKQEADCVYQYFPPTYPFKTKGVGDCDKCKPSEENKNCPMFSKRFTEKRKPWNEGGN